MVLWCIVRITMVQDVTSSGTEVVGSHVRESTLCRCGFLRLKKFLESISRMNILKDGIVFGFVTYYNLRHIVFSLELPDYL